ncbi:hypothetical protein CB1_001443009 [Camelus ferus]|nr:hypothetical protein CB1_001443009 [Camelus ferus]
MTSPWEEQEPARFALAASSLAQDQSCLWLVFTKNGCKGRKLPRLVPLFSLFNCLSFFHQLSLLPSQDFTGWVMGMPAQQSSPEKRTTQLNEVSVSSELWKTWKRLTGEKGRGTDKRGMLVINKKQQTLSTQLGNEGPARTKADSLLQERDAPEHPASHGALHGGPSSPPIALPHGGEGPLEWRSSLKPHEIPLAKP